MIKSGFLTLLVGACLTQALVIPGFSHVKDQVSNALNRRGFFCPPVWFQVSHELTGLFRESNGQCNDAARAAIRASFHDAATFSSKLPVVAPASGGADGSLILAQEYLRPENNGLQDISVKLGALAQKYHVGVADMIQFAGAHATITCPLGPPIRVLVGRKDTSTPSPNGLLPDVHSDGDTLLGEFKDKGFNAAELAALLGAHTCAKQFFVDPSLAGQAQDSSPGVWDIDFYAETNSPPQGVFVLPSDKVLSTHPEVGPAFQGFVNQKIKWDVEFALAMGKMSLLGIPTGAQGLTDCTVALPLPLPI